MICEIKKFREASEVWPFSDRILQVNSRGVLGVEGSGALQRRGLPSSKSI